MLRMILLRLPQMLIVVLGVSFLTYSIMFLLPGDVVSYLLGDNYTEEAAEALRQELHLDQPFLVRYFTWLGDFLTGQGGTSLIPPHQEVWDLVWKSLLPTVELLIVAEIFAIVVAVLFAVISVLSRSRVVDRVIQAIALACNSIPGFVLGLLLIMLFSVQLKLLSPRGWVSPFGPGGSWAENIGHILFPGIVLGIFTFPVIMRVFRAELVEQLDFEDYVTLARLKGIPGRRVVFNHLLRNSSFGLLTVVGINLARLIGGAVIIEAVFAIPGMGTLIRTSVVSHDTPTALVTVTVIAIFVVVMNLIIDVLYAVLDPRVRDAG